MCPHANIIFCPLYIAMHTGRGGSCWPDDGEIQTGCAVAKGADYEMAVAKLNIIDFETVTRCEIEERRHKSRLLAVAKWAWKH